MDERLRLLEIWKEQAELRFERLNNELRDNTLMTAAVKKDTAELVQLFKASKVNLGILKWIAGIAAALLALYQGVKHL